MKNKTEYIRVIKNRNYTVLNNEFLKRKDLSWKAKGILAYILSLPDDWDINLNEVIRHATEGESAFRSGWKELDTLGYVSRYPVKDEKTKRIVHWETVVRESVGESTEKPHSEKPDVEKPHVDKPDVDNRKLLSTKELSTNKQNTKSNKEIVEQSSQSDKSDYIPYKKIVEYLNKKTGRNFRHTTDKTKRLIKARANEGFELDDFMKVIDIKVVDWKDSSKMSKYLKPDTLFSPKFEGYLNQPVSNAGKERDWNRWDFMDDK